MALKVQTHSRTLTAIEAVTIWVTVGNFVLGRLSHFPNRDREVQSDTGECMVPIDNHGFVTNLYYSDDHVLPIANIDTELHADGEVIDVGKFLAADLLSKSAIPCTVALLGRDRNFEGITL